MTEPPETVKRELALTGLTYYLDTNLVDDQSPAMVTLRRARSEGWLRLQRTDVMDTELSEAPDERRDELLGLSSEYAESLGPWILGESRLGHMVLASDEDGERFERVFAILKPGIVDPRRGRSNDVRDAMQVATALRYAGDGFVTRDQNILRHAQEFADLTPAAFAVDTPEPALEQLRDAVARHLRRHQLMQSTAWVPEWRP